jgi:hypothetical protein
VRMAPMARTLPRAGVRRVKSLVLISVGLQ